VVAFNRERNAAGTFPAAIERAQVEERAAQHWTDLAPLNGIEVLARISQAIQETLNDEDVKPSVADLIRLLGLRRELAQLQTGTVKVGWVECRRNPAIDQ
jgi:hypothetical protein